MQLCQRVKLRELYNLEPELFLKENIGLELALTAEDLDGMDREPDSIPLSRIFERKNLKVYTLHAPFQDLNLSSADPFLKVYAIKRLNSALEFCRDYQISKMVFHTGINPLLPPSKREASYQRFSESLSFIIKNAKKYGVELLVENTYEPGFFYFDKMFTDFPELKMTFDLGHSICFANEAPEEYLKRYQEKIIHYHLHDNNGEDDSHLTLGEGVVPFTSLAPLMDNSLTATLETPLTSLEENIKRFKSIFA